MGRRKVTPGMYVLPEKLRSELAKPLAPPLPTDRAVAAVRGKLVVSVGDVVTEMLLDHGLVPHVCVVDYRTKRGEPRFDAPLRAKIERAYAWRERFENPAATLSQTLWDAVEAALKRREPSALEVVGEEDLAALPAIVFAPDGAVVVYGQPDEGAVVLTINAEARARVGRFLSQMEVRGVAPKLPPGLVGR